MACMHGFSRLCLVFLGTNEPHINELSPNDQLLGKFLEYADNLIATAHKNLLLMTISEQQPVLTILIKVKAAAKTKKNKTISNVINTSQVIFR